MSEYLSEEEQLEQLRSFWKTWGIPIVAGVVLAAGGYFGWNAWGEHKRDQAMAASALYQNYLDAGDDEGKSAAALKALTDAADGSSYHAFVLLKQAAKAIEAGKLEDAEPLLRQILEKGDEPLLRSLASIRLASVLQGLDKGDEALKLLDRVTGAGFRTTALEMKGDIHMARKERAEAHTAYKAALDSIEDGQKDSLLEAKVANAAPVPGQAAKKADANAESGADEKKDEPATTDANEAGADDSGEANAEQSNEAASEAAAQEPTAAEPDAVAEPEAAPQGTDQPETTDE